MARWKAFIPIVLALAIATGGSVFLYGWIQAKTAPAATVTVESQAVPVVVAAVDLNWGTKLGGVSAVIKPGMRAVAVKGDKVIGISGFIQPGNRVDVLVTLRDPKTKNEITKMVLSNVLVLATGTELEERRDGQPRPVDVYTLEVDPEQAERLSLAAAEGKLQFALRNMTDQETVLTKGATITQTLASLRGEDPTPPAKVKEWVPPARSVTVEVIRGGKVTQQKFTY
jgi:pilus assembly protein CpaB